jgi:hypothetical protein
MRGRLVIAATGLAIAATAGGIAAAGTPFASSSPASGPSSPSSKTGQPAARSTGVAQPPEQAMLRLARVLHVSPARAAAVLASLDALAQPDSGVDPNSAAFARLAASLDRTPQQLADALATWKRGLAHEPPSPAPVGQQGVKKSPHR